MYITQMLVQYLPLVVSQPIYFTHVLVCIQKETLLCHPHIYSYYHQDNKINQHLLSLYPEQSKCFLCIHLFYLYKPELLYSYEANGDAEAQRGNLGNWSQLKSTRIGNLTDPSSLNLKSSSLTISQKCHRTPYQ